LDELILLVTGVRSTTSLSSAAVTIGPRMGPDSMKPNPVILQNVAHRPPSMTITSTSTVQVGAQLISID